MENKNNPIDNKEKVQQSNDEHIDQDFEGYPHPIAKENIINPQTETDKETAALDSDNINEYANSSEHRRSGKHKDDIDEIASDGSGGAFSATEEVEDQSEESFKKEENQNKSKFY